MDIYIKNFKNFDTSIIYDFKKGYGGIGDYLKFCMIILTHCMNNNIRFYNKINNIELEKYIKFKHNIFNITNDEIKKLKNYIIKLPRDYYYLANKKEKYSYNLNLNEVFYFDEIVKLNIKNILSFIPNNYISIHLRMGDKYLETDKKFVLCKNDKRTFLEEKIHKFIETNNNKKIIFFCDNNNYKLKIKKKYENIIITNSKIGHTSLSNTTSKQILDAVTDFYILSNSELIYAVSKSGFSHIASKFKNIKYIN